MRILKHLRSCRRCFEIYQDSAIYQGLWHSRPSEFDATKELVEAGEQIVHRESSSETAHENGGRTRIPPWFKRRLRFSLAVLSGAILLAAGLWLSSVNQEKESSLDISMLVPIQTAVETACERVLIMFPECDHFLGQGTPVYRSGYVPLNDSLKTSLEYLYEAYQQGKASPEAAYWLIAGYVATGQMDAARDIAPRARKQHPGDSMISILDAIIAYFDGNYDRAETLLRKVLDADPNNSVASINLAVVLVEQSKGAEAKRILTRVIERHAGTPLAERAQAILSDL